MQIYPLTEIQRKQWLLFDLAGESARFRLLLASQTLVLARAAPVDTKDGPGLEEVRPSCW